MIPAPFAYRRARSLGEAFDALGEPGALAIAGGQALVAQLKRRAIRPRCLVDIGGLELGAIEAGEESVRIGALTTWAEIGRSPAIRRGLAPLAEAAAVQGDRQVRNRATIGGALALADPASDVWASALALDLSVATESRSGRRTVSADQLMLGPGETVLDPGELIVSVHTPKLGAGSGAAYRSIRDPASHYPLVGVAARVTTTRGEPCDVRIGVTALGRVPFRLTDVEAAVARGGSRLRDAAGEALGRVEPVPHATIDSDYRRHLGAVTCERAVLAAIASARGGAAGDD